MTSRASRLRSLNRSVNRGLAVVVSALCLVSCESWTSCERYPGRCPGPVKLIGLGPKTSGTAGPVTWRWVDGKASEDNSRYSAVLILTETTGQYILFTSLKRQIWGPGGRAPGGGGALVDTQSGSWRLPANGELRLPMAVSISCPSATCTRAIPPFWEILLIGKDATDRDMRIEIDVALPVR
jgi:hypothetical protein